MAVFPIHNFYIGNKELKPVSEYKPEESTGSVYEVVRIIRGVPLFLSDHLKRLLNSVVLANLNMSYSENEIEDSLGQLIHANQISEGNILLAYRENLVIYFIPHKYPGQVLYENGIRLGVLHAERQNPNAKVFQTLVRKLADEMKITNDFYEVLLVDHLERITEGSSSNIFFISKNKLVTAPASEVLPGITRQKVIQLAGMLNTEVVERSIYFKELASFDAAFISGTSPKILPVNQIGDIFFDPQNQLMKNLIDAYDNLIEEYVSTR